MRGDAKVATSPYTFAATAEVIRYLGADPVFVDIEEDSYNLSPERLQHAFDASFEQVCHRLTTLQKLGAKASSPVTK